MFSLSGGCVLIIERLFNLTIDKVGQKLERIRVDEDSSILHVKVSLNKVLDLSES